MKAKFLILQSIFVLIFFGFAFSKSYAADKPQIQNQCKITVELQNFYDKDLIEKEISKTEGVMEVYVDLDEKITYISFNPQKTNPDNLCKKIQDLGYKAEVKKE